MFDSLDEQMRKDDKRTSGKERLMRWAIMAIAALVVFVAVIAGVRLMS
jgi:flagellar biosynthesis/type III secretory pathway M-ring protein FliF/YscJ